MFKNTRSLIGAAALAIMLPMASLAATNESCTIIADAARNATKMRLAGASQQATAHSATVWFTRFINDREVMRNLSNAERRAFAHNWSSVATRMIQIVYTIPRERLLSDGFVAETFYRACMEGSPR